MSCARPPHPSPRTKQQGWGPGTQRLCSGSAQGSEGRAWAPEPWRRGRVTHRGGRPGPSCLQSQGGDRVEADGSRSREEGTADAGGRGAPAGGALDPGRSRRGLDALQEEERLPRRQQGTGAGRGGGWPAAEAWGGGRWRAGGRVSNCRHPHRRQPAGQDCCAQRGLGGGRLQGRIPTGAPTHLPLLLSHQGGVPEAEGFEGGLTSAAGVGDLVQQEGLWADTRKDFLDWERRQRDSIPPGGFAGRSHQPPGCLPRKLGSGVERAKYQTWVGEGDCIHTRTHTGTHSFSLSALSSCEAEKIR